MGNSCTKELSMLSKAVAGKDTHASTYRNTEMSRLNSPELSQVKDSQVKYAILHPQIKDILLRLSYSEIQILLNIFRLKVRWIRMNQANASSPLDSTGGASSPKPSSESSPDSYAWKRLSLSKQGVFEIFPSLHPEALQRSWTALMTDFHFPSNAATVTISRHIHQMVHQENLFKMFLFSDYKNGIISQASSDFPQEIIFQDFATIAAILLHGSKEELFTLLFLLFSEETVMPVSPPANSSSAPSLLMRGFSRRQSSENHTNTNNTNHLIPGGIVEADHGMVMDHSKSHSLDGSIASHSQSQSRDSPDHHKEAVHTNSHSESKTEQHQQQKKKLVLTDRRLIELLLFMACLWYHEDSSSQRQRLAMRQNQEFMRFIGLVKDLLTHHSVVVERLLTSSSSRSDHLSLSGFLRSILSSSPDHSPSHTSSSHNTSWNRPQLLSGCNVSRVLVSSLFQPLFHDLIPNPFQVVKTVLDLYHTSPAILSLKTSLTAFRRLVTSSSSNELFQQERADLLSQSHDIFLLDYDWWIEFCEVMALQPVYSEVAPALVIDLTVTDDTTTTNNHSNSNSNSNTTFSKYELFDLFLASSSSEREEEEEGQRDSACAQMIIDVMTMSLLDNLSLLTETSPETYDYLPPDRLSAFPKDSNRNNSSNNSSNSLTKHYVILPYEIGKTLYLYYDLSAHHLSAAVYRRCLRYLTNTASPDYLSHLAQSKEEEESLSKTAIHYFVNNFQQEMPLTICCDVYDYYQLPVYLTTPLGLASVQPLDRLDYYYDTTTNSLNSDLRETSSVRDLLAGLVKRYGLVSSSASTSKGEMMESQYRLWVLSPIQSLTPISYRERSTRLPFTTHYEWILVTEQPSDYHRDCQGFLWDLYLSHTNNTSNANSQTNTSTSRGKKELAQGLMIETRNEESLWPTDNLLSAQLSKNVMVLTDSDSDSGPNHNRNNNPSHSPNSPRNPTNNTNPSTSNTNNTNPTNPEDDKVLRVGLAIDFLCDDSIWRPAIITHIHKIDSLSDLSSLRRSLVLTLKYYSSTGTRTSDLPSSQSGEAVSEVPFESHRLLVYGTVTELLALHCHPALHCEEVLRSQALKALKRSPVFRDLLSSSQSPPLLPPLVDPLVKPSTHSNTSTSSSNTVLVTPNGKSTARNSSSVVPITVAFTPEPLSPHHTVVVEDLSPHQPETTRSPSQLETSRWREQQIDQLTVDDLEGMDLDLLEYLARSEDRMKSYMVLRLSDEYSTGYLRTYKELVVYRVGSSHPSSDLSNRKPPLFTFPNSTAAKGNLIEALEAQAEDNKTANRSSGNPAKSPGKQLLSKWDRLFPATNGTGNGTGNGKGEKDLPKASSQINVKSGKSNNNSMENIPPFSMNEALTTATSSTNNPNSKKAPLTSNNSNPSSAPNSAHTSLNRSTGLAPLLNPAIATTHTTSAPPPLMVERASFDLSRRMGIVGLNNLGNTCFLSSALQCLLRTPIFIPYFLSYQYKFDINDRSKFGTGGRVTEEFGEFVRTVYHPALRTLSANPGKGGGGLGGNNKTSSQQFYNYFGKPSTTTTATTASNSNNTPTTNNNSNNTTIKASQQTVSHFQRVAISPITFYKLFQKHKSQFTGADQQDAQEFLSELLDTFHEDLKNDLSLDKDNKESHHTNNNRPEGDLRNMIHNDYSRRSLMRLSLDQSSFREKSDRRERSLSAELIAQSHHSHSQSRHRSLTTHNREEERSNTNNKITKKLSPHITAAVRDIIIAGHKTWDDYTRGNDSIVTNVFQGQLCTHVSCSSCGQSSTRFEPFTTLSLPIPKATLNLASSSLLAATHYSSSGSEVVNVVIRFYRKYPRWSVYWRLRQYLLAQLGGQVTAAAVDQWLRRAVLQRVMAERKAVKRFVLKCSKQMTIEMIKTKALEVINSHWGSSPSSNNSNQKKKQRASYSEQSFQQVFTGDLTTATNSHSNSPRGRASSSRTNKREGLEVENVEENDEMTLNEPQTNPSPPLNNNTNNPINNNNTNNPTNQTNNTSTGSDGSDYFEDSLHYDLQLANLTMIDLSAEEKFRIRKIVENKEYLASVIDENSSSSSSNECELLLVENNKDIAMISSLPSSKLNVSPDSFHRHHLVQLNQALASPLATEIFSSHSNSEAVVSSKREELEALLVKLLFGYVEEEEYHDSNLYHRLLLHTSPPLPPSSDNSNNSTNYHTASSSGSGSQEYIPEKLICDLDYYYSTNTTNSTTSTNPSTPTSSQSQSQTRRSSSTRPFPRTIQECRLFDRVDALDHKDQWYSGSVVEIVSFPLLESPPVKKTSHSHSHSRSSSKPGSSSNVTQREAAVPKQEEEVFIRVHFDNYSHLWDEWYDGSEFSQGCVAPIFTRTNRKLKIYDIQIVQRKLLYTLTSNSPNNSNNLELAKIELVEEPFVLQVESYRSISHLYSQVVEQISRYLPSDYLEKLLATSHDSHHHHKGAPPSFETLKFPFEIRMVNIQNLFAAPLNPASYSSVSSNSHLTDRSKEKFERHKLWEGLNLPKFDRDRPVANIYHPKLILAIDWEYLHLATDSSSSSSNSSSSRLVLLSDYLTMNSSNTSSNTNNNTNNNSNSGGDSVPPLLSLLPEVDCDDHETMIEYEKLYRSHLASSSTVVNTTTNTTSNHSHSHHTSTTTVNSVMSYPWIVDQSFRHRNADRKVYHLQPSTTASTASAGTTPTTPNPNNSHNNSHTNPSHTSNSSNTTSSHSKSHDPRPGLTIEEVLSNFTAKEEIDYFCDRCQELKKGLMYASIHKAPDVLILHLKRLVMNSTGGAKIRTLVKFPLQNLDLSQFMTQNMALKTTNTNTANTTERAEEEEEEPPLLGDLENAYDLFGVVNHLGGMYGGHYTAYAQCEDLLLATASNSNTPPPTSNRVVHSVQTCSELRSLLFDTAEVSLQDYSLSPDKIHPLTALPSLLPPLPPSSNSNNSSNSSPVKAHQVLSPTQTLETTYRWYKFDDDYAIELTSQHSPIEPTIVSESAYLLFYKKKQLSPESILRYT